MLEFAGLRAGLFRTVLAQCRLVMRRIIAVLAGAVVAAVLFQVAAAVAFVTLYDPTPSLAGRGRPSGIASLGRDAGLMSAHLRSCSPRWRCGAFPSRHLSGRAGIPGPGIVGVVGTLAGRLPSRGGVSELNE